MGSTDMCEMVVDGSSRVLEPVAGHDPFDLLHDSIILRILNYVGDIKSLGRCALVSKRFCTLAFCVENVTVKIDCIISGEEACVDSNARGGWAHLVRLVVGSFTKPLQALQHILAPNNKKGSGTVLDVSHRSPVEILRNFKAVQNLKIEVPGGELGNNDGILLKWRAEFGSTLENCVILGASSFLERETKKCSKGQLEHDREVGIKSASPINSGLTQADDVGALPELFYTNGGLKRRVIWTISSLIAASARHFLLKQVITEHASLINLVVTDADGEGTLCMCKEQLLRFANSPLADSASSNRTQIPALSLKLWYASHLELPEGSALKGATLVVIWPNEQPICKEVVHQYIPFIFAEPFNTAAILLSERRTYLLEMNSF